MARIIPSLNLNHTPQQIQTNSLIFAKNIKLDDNGGALIKDDDIKIVSKIQEAIEYYHHSQNDKFSLTIKGSIATPRELVVFCYSNAGNIVILRYNEDYDKVTTINTSLTYNNGEYIGSYNYNARNELIIVFSEKNCDKDIPLRTINCGAFDDSVNILNKSVSDESYYNLAPNIPICKCKLNNLFYGISIPTGVYQFFIRYKLDSINYTKWFPIGRPYYSINSEDTKIIDYKLESGNKANTAEFDMPVNNLNLDSQQSFCLGLDFKNIPEYINKYQIGYILSKNNALVGRIYNEYDISTNEILFDAKFIETTDVQNFIHHNINLYNVKNIVNYNNRLYVSNYKEHNDNINFDTSNIKVRFIATNTQYITNSNASTYKYKYNFSLRIREANDPNTLGKIYDISYFATKPNKTNNNELIINESICNNIGISIDGYIYEEKHNFDDTYYYKEHSIRGLTFIIENNTLTIKGLDKKNVFYYSPVALNHREIPTDAYISDKPLATITLLYGSITYEGIINGITGKTDCVQSLMPNEVYNFFIHYVRSDGSYTNGIRISNNTFYPVINELVLTLKELKDIYGSRLKDAYPISDELINLYPNTKLFEIYNSSITDYSSSDEINGELGYYKNSKGDSMFKAPAIYDKQIIPLFSQVTVPDGFIGYFFSYEKIENTVLYECSLGNLFRATEAELGLQSYKGSYIRLPNNNCVSIHNIKLWASNVYTKTIGSNGGIEIDSFDIESFDEFKRQRFQVCRINNNIYTKKEKTLIRMTDIFYKDENVDYSLSDFNLPSYLLKDYYIEYAFPVAFMTSSDKPTGFRKFDVETNKISDEVLTSSFITDSYNYVKHSNFNLDCISIKQNPTIGSVIIDNKIYIEKYIEPSNLSDTFEIKSDYLISELGNINILISSSAYNPDAPTIEQFDNTVRRSDVFANESIENTWRNFSASNYKVISNTRGKIKKLIPLGKYFLVHLENGLFAFDRDNKMKLQDKEIQLSTPDTFDLEAQEVYTSENGFLGLQNEDSTLINSYGYTFYEHDTKVIYNYDAGKLNILSFPIQRLLNTTKIEKVIMAYDGNNDRSLFCFYTEDSTFTISYNYLAKAFISLHDFEFSKAWHTKNNVYLNTIDNNHIVIFTKDNQDNKYSYASSANNNNQVFPVMSCCDRPNAVIDIIFNEAYEVPKVLNSISYVLTQYYQTNHCHIYQAEDDFNLEFSGENMMIYSDICATDELNVRPKSNDYNISDITSNMLPWYDKGVWNFNYFKNIRNQVNYTGDDMSLIYGKYFVVRFIFDGSTCFKLENISFNISRY